MTGSACSGLKYPKESLHALHGTSVCNSSASPFGAGKRVLPNRLLQIKTFPNMSPKSTGVRLERSHESRPAVERLRHLLLQLIIKAVEALRVMFEEDLDGVPSHTVRVSRSWPFLPDKDRKATYLGGVSSGARPHGTICLSSPSQEFGLPVSSRATFLP